MRFFRRKGLYRGNLPKASFVTERSIRTLHDTILSNNEHKYCLEIGLNDKSENCITIDLGDKADIVGDIRGSFAQHGGYEPVIDIDELPKDYFAIIKMVHTVEHIEWLYQQSMFDWVFDLLRTGGRLYIDTPNLDTIIKTYVENKKRLKDGMPLNYPYSEHPDFSSDQVVENFMPWVNYKLYSGCSVGDYHHTCLNATWLMQLLDNAGFKKIMISSGHTLLGIAIRPEEEKL